MRYGEAISGSNFKSLFISIVILRQDLRQVGIDEVLLDP